MAVPRRPRRRRGPSALIVAVAAAVALLSAAVVLRGTATHQASAQEVVPLGPQGLVPQFLVECRFGHLAPDDPIVFPGQPGASHLHQFFGASEVDAGSTADSLRGGPTTCQQQLDTAAYWAPALLVDGSPVEPLHLNAYYRPGPGVDPAIVEPFPPGLAMITGDAHATDVPPLSVAAWHCGSSSDVRATPPACPADARLALRITFPDCWDGEHVDTPDHRSHMGRSAGGRCPDSHPVAVPQLVMDIHYPVSGSPELLLASGALTTAHADFLNAWDQDKLETEVRLCINRQLTCGVASNRATG